MDLSREPLTVPSGKNPTQSPHAVTVHDRLRAMVDALPVEGIAPGRLDAILAGERQPTSLDLALIADATGVTVTWLLHGRHLHRPVSAT